MVGLGLKSQGSAPEFTGESRQLSCICIVKWLCSELFIISWSNQENQNPQQLWSKTDSNLRKDQPNSRAVVQSVGSGVRPPSPHPPFYQRLTSCVTVGTWLCNSSSVNGDSYLPGHVMRIKFVCEKVFWTESST